MNIVEQASLYKTHDFYRRERRKFRKNLFGFGSRPNAKGLKPEQQHILLGERDTWLDNSQCVFGYFFGGGWIYGVVENTKFRALSSGLNTFENAPDNRNNLNVAFRAGALMSLIESESFNVPAQILPDPSELPSDSYLSINVERDRLSSSMGYPLLDPGPLPPMSALREIDALAVSHDRALRERDEKKWKGDIEEGDPTWRELSKAANGELLDALREINWANKRQELKDHKQDLVALDHWEQMVSLNAYELYISKVAIAGLLANKVLQGLKDAILCPPPDETRFLGRQACIKATTATAPDILDLRGANAEVRERYAAAQKMKQEAEDFFTMEGV